MNNFLLIGSLLLITTACNKSEFKETKIAPMPSTQMGSTVDMSNMNGKELPPGHPPIDGKSSGATMPVSQPQVEKAAVNVGNIAKAKGGIQVADCFMKKANLKNAKVIIRGKVVKYNSGILGKNWIHLRDGSGKEGSNDLVVTTEQNAKVNDTVTVTGVLSYDKDIGSGYFFPAIIENAAITVE